MFYSKKNLPPPVGVKCTMEERMTRSSEKKACDINVIIARYHKTGVLPIKNREAFFMDVSELGDYRAVLDRVRMAEEVFGQLPAATRSAFKNDVGEFLDSCVDPAQRGRLVELGLLESEEAVTEELVERPVEAPQGPQNAP